MQQQQDRKMLFAFVETPEHSIFFLLLHLPLCVLFKLALFTRPGVSGTVLPTQL